MTDSQRRLWVTWIAKPGSEGRVKAILVELAAASRQELGCLRYTVYQATDDPRQFVLYEEYRDAEALAAHGESEHFKRLVLTEAVPVLESRRRVGVEVIAEAHDSP